MTSLAELFARDPREHSDADVLRIITELRKAREKFVLDKAKPASTPRTAKQKAVAKIDLDIKL